MGGTIKKVLLVDTSEISINRLTRLLGDLRNVEYIGSAASSSEAISIATLMKPDVVIMDIQLAGQNGISVLQDIRKNFSTVKIIVLTNSSESHYNQLCRATGADYFFDKSTEFEKIPEVLSLLTTNRTPAFPKP